MIFQTDYSISLSSLTVKTAIELAKENGYNQMVVADNTLSSVLEFYKASVSSDMKPVIGLDIDHNGAQLLLIAKNGYGYKALHSLPIEEAVANKDVVSFLTGATNVAALQQEFLRGVTYVVPKGNKILGLFAAKYKRDVAELPASVNMFSKEEYRTNEGMAAIKASSLTPSTKTQKVHTIAVKQIVEINEVQSPAEIKKSFPELQAIVDAATTDGYDFSVLTPPHFPFLEEENVKSGMARSTSEDELLAHLSYKGLEERGHTSDEYKARLQVELDIIRDMGFPGYMLMVRDFISMAHNMNIPTGPGRGSAAGSLVSYALRITDIDPIPYGLLFERFLNPARVSMPDIDMDFCEAGRGDLIAAVTEKYGQEHVAQIITFGTFAAKAAFKDAARVSGLNTDVSDRVTKEFPDILGISLSEVLEKPNPALANYLKDPVIARSFKLAVELEGHKKGHGVHPAGLVIADKPINHHAPVLKVGDATVVGFEGKDLEDVNLIKFDFLGLKTLTVIADAMKFVKEIQGVEVVIPKDYNDVATYEMLKAGTSAGVFQVESAGMIKLLKDSQPENFEDLTALIALYRPGPMESGMLEDYVARKKGEQEVSYFGEFAEVLTPILSPTFGVFVYQEQIMQAVQVVAGFSLGEADLVRRAMGKKKISEMEKISQDFIDGAVKKGFTAKGAKDLFDRIEKFAGYGFNKSHSAAYAVLAFQTAYLKANYPAEYMTSIMNHNYAVKGSQPKLPRYLAEARFLGVEVKPLSLNASTELFETDGKTITYALKALKGVGTGATTFVKAQEAGEFISVIDFVERAKKAKVKKSVFSAFIKVGMFDFLGASRQHLLENDAKIFAMKAGWKELAEASIGAPDFTESQKIELELDIAGVIISDPFEVEKVKSFLSGFKVPRLSELEEGSNFVVVYPQNFKLLTAKKSGKQFGILTAFYGGEIEEFAAFSKTLDVVKGLEKKLTVLEVELKDGRKTVKRVLNSKQFASYFPVKRK